MQRHRWLAILPLFALSGGSGLVYQVLWVREFALAFGNTTYSAAVVTAAFMSGLGLGSWLGGALADRWHRARPHRVLAAYGGAEIGIGLFGAGLAWLLPKLASLSPALSAYVAGTHGWHHLSIASYAARYALAFLVLAPPTVLMGSTLALLVRWVVPRDPAGAGASVGVLYGVNTLGAAGGALVAQTVVVPAVGVLRTQLLAALLNLVVGAAALALFRASRGDARASGARDDDAPPAADVDRDAAAPARPPARETAREPARFASVALALTGFAGMGLEILWLRFLLSAIGGYAASFAILLAIILLGMWGGSMLSGVLLRRSRRPGALFAVSAALLVVVVMACLLQHDRSDLNSWFLAAHNEIDDDAGLPVRVQLLGTARTVALVVGAPALLMGVTFPLANAVAQRAADRVGRRAGQLYLANTLGATAGSLVTGFVLLPTIGTQGAVLVVGVALALAIGAMGWAARDEGRSARWSVAGALAVAVVAVTVWGGVLPKGRLLAATLPRFGSGDVLLDVHEGPGETIAITEEPTGTRRLWTNGHSMSSTQPAALRYMRAFAHLPFLLLERPTRGLVICFGVGNTARAALLHPSVESFDIADLSADILERAPFFARTNHDVLQDARAHVYVDDGRHRLAMASPDAYDLVTLEPPPIAFAGVSSLYSSEFYALAKSRLSPGGYLSQWLPIYQLSTSAALSAIRSFVDVFPNAVLLSGDKRELILLGRKSGAVEIDPEDVARRLDERPLVRDELVDAHLGTLTEIVGTFVANASALTAATANARPVTDDDPIMEHAFVSGFVMSRLPREVFRVDGVSAWCPTCAARPDLVPHVGEYLELLDSMYQSDAFLTYRAYALTRTPITLPPDAEGRYAETVRASAYLQSLAP